jgi:endonuclease/exonuclease/phosphatase family metal-dependent hydrolase
MRILTWNIQWGRGLDGRVDLARMVSTIKSHGAFDVVCLQEVANNFPGLPGSRGEDQPAELARLLPEYQCIFAPATDVPDATGRRKQFGNAILSRLPVGQIYRHLLPWPCDPAVPGMQRVLLEAVVAAPWGPLRVMTTHLEYYSATIRAAQIDAIRALHAEACAHARTPREGKGEEGGSFEVFARPASAVLCGDMNFPATAAERAQLLAPYADATENWRDSWEVLQPGVPHAATAGVHEQTFVDTPQCYDFMFITAGLAPRLRALHVDAATTASDHQPVWIELDNAGIAC